MFGDLLSAETLYMKSPQVKVRADKTPDSKVLLVMEKGDPVEVIEKSCHFYKVKLPDGQEGWIFKWKLTNKIADPLDTDILKEVDNEDPLWVLKEHTSSSSIRGRECVDENSNKKGLFDNPSPEK